MSTLHLQRHPNATDRKFTFNHNDKTWTMTELFPPWIHGPRPTLPNTPPAEKDEEEVSPTSPSHPTNVRDFENAPSSPSYKPGSPINLYTSTTTSTTNFYTNPLHFQEIPEEYQPTSPDYYKNMPTSPTSPSYSPSSPPIPPTSPTYSDTTPEPVSPRFHASASPSYPPNTHAYSPGRSASTAPLSKPERDESDGCPCTSCALHASMFGGDADARGDSDEEVVYTGEVTVTPAKRRKIDLAKAMEDDRFIDLTEGVATTRFA